MTVEDWLTSACADADRRGMPDLRPLLASLADATRELRSAGWDDGAILPAKPDSSALFASPAPPAPRAEGAVR